MGKFKRGLYALFAAICAVVLSLGAATNAYADAYDHTVTFTGVGEGDTVSAYQLMSYTDGNYNSYYFDEGFKLFCRDYADSLNENSSDADIASYLRGLTSDQNRQLLSAYVNAWSGDAVTPGSVSKPGLYTESSQAPASGSVEMSFRPGYYLVMPNTTNGSVGSRLYNPVSVFVKVNGNESTIAAGGQTAQAGNITVQMKSQNAPELEKYLVRADGKLHKTRTVSPGETVQFAVKVSFGSLSDGIDPTPVVHDTLTNLECKGGFEVHVVNADGSIGNLISDGIQEADGSDYANGSQTVAVRLDWGKISPDGSAKSVYVTYSATVADDIVASAVNGRYTGSNEAYLTYRTNAQSGEESKTNPSSTDVYTFALSLEKLDANGNALTGAKFKLYDTNAANPDTPVRFKKVVDANGSVTYYVVEADDTTAGTVDELEANAGDKGNELHVRGIDCSHTYTLQESVTPKGYYAPASTWTLSFTSLKTEGNADEHTGSLETASASSTDSSANALVPVNRQQVTGATFEMAVMNSSTPTLPTTGGMGTVLFTVAGVALMVIAAAVYFFARRRNN